jgi:hypothetical protein
MATSPEQLRQNRRAQRRLARELKDIREGRAQWRKSEAGKAYSRALSRMAAPVLIVQHFIAVLTGDEIRHNRDTITFNVDRMTVTQRELSLTFDVMDLQYYASIQSAGNVWWYHKSDQNYFNEWRGKTWNAPVPDAG